jgi:RAB protein geranylgeranyltransferase component A
MKKPEEILTKFWWTHYRFEFIGHHIADCLNKNNTLKQELRNVFRSHNDKLCYYDFF